MMSCVDNLRMIIIHQIVSQTIKFCKKENLVILGRDLDLDWKADTSQVSNLCP